MLQNISLEEIGGLEVLQEGVFAKILDVRSPCEFLHSHIPNALNLPVLSDIERQEVGIMYKQNPFEARILGASFICANTAKIIHTLKTQIHPKHKILLYCARGGQRSQSLSVILNEIGYQIYRLKGGYKMYRNAVCQKLQTPNRLRFVTLYGLTGSGKSEIIQQCKFGIDIEKLANHYGSSFGQKGSQPSPKMFQNLLTAEIIKQEKQEGIALVECESKKLGQIVLPSLFFESYQKGIKIYIDSPLEDRILRIMREYGGMTEEFFMQAMKKIQPYMQRTAYLACLDFFQKGKLHESARILLQDYYDRVYKKMDCDYRIVHKNLSSTLAQIEEIILKMKEE